MKLLITGGSGFIGSHLREFFSRHGFEIHFTHRRELTIPGYGTPYRVDLSDPIRVSALFSEINPDFVIHLASHARPTRDLDEFELHWQDTILPALNVAREVSSTVKLVAFVGSCEEYGNGPVPFLEDQAPKIFSPYGWGKTCALEAIRYIGQARSLRWCWLRPFLTFGPGQDSELFFPSVARACTQHSRVELTAGEQTRDFVYIEDLCRMFLSVITHPDKASGQILNLCSGVPRSLRSVGTLIQELAGGGELIWGARPYRAEEAMQFYGSPEKFRMLFGDTPMTPFRDAVARTLAAGVRDK